MIAISLAFMAEYAWWRITATLPPPGLTFEYAIALVFLVAEMGGVLAAALSLCLSLPDAGPIGRRRRER